MIILPPLYTLIVAIAVLMLLVEITSHIPRFAKSKQNERVKRIHSVINEVPSSIPQNTEFIRRLNV